MNCPFCKKMCKETIIDLHLPHCRQEIFCGITVCTFNENHIVPEPERKNHESKCPDRHLHHFATKKFLNSAEHQLINETSSITGVCVGGQDQPVKYPRGGGQQPVPEINCMNDVLMEIKPPMFKH